jgi:hypothetical protein
MTGRINPDDVRLLTRLPHARAKADRLRDLAAQSPMIQWTMSDTTAIALADIIERGADAIEGIEAQLRVEDQAINAARVAIAVSKAKLAASIAERQRGLIITAGSALVVATLASIALVVHLAAVIGHG